MRLRRRAGALGRAAVRVGWLLGAGLCLAMAPAGAQTAAQASAAGAVPVSASGYTQALREVKLGLTVTGRLDRLFVKEGDRVRRGDLILQLDHRAEALEVERRTLLLKDVSRLEELRRREAMLKTQLESAQTLLQTGGMSRKQVEDEELALSNVVAERRGLEISKQRERVELDLATEALDKRFLRAPAEGVVTKIALRDGESVAAHEPAVVLSDASRVRFLGTLPLAEAVRLAPRSRVTLRLGPDGRDAVRQAQIVFISPVADPASGLVEFIAEFDNPDGSVRPGVTGRLVLGADGAGRAAAVAPVVPVAPVAPAGKAR